MPAKQPWPRTPWPYVKYAHFQHSEAASERWLDRPVSLSARSAWPRSIGGDSGVRLRRCCDGRGRLLGLSCGQWSPAPLSVLSPDAVPPSRLPWESDTAPLGSCLHDGRFVIATAAKRINKLIYDHRCVCTMKMALVMWDSRKSNRAFDKPIMETFKAQFFTFSGRQKIRHHWY